ncbi:FkbM family methyltransferase [Rhizobiales bacterium]|uniref:FkbM family methyltransferase n=1 Tax=Hongsoonwoonella zoysiae TaxID=2821844 RepID=UPI00155F5F09|nr:FkbM family methyltransferase [Hongsoonwoonella zoysiae]NRG16502.1 FkbM family methyltransferase [Hongsoonwoonella zoysiae]
MQSAARPLTDTKSPFGTYAGHGVGRFVWALADRRSLAKPVRRRLRRVAESRFAGPYDTTVDGLKFRLYPGENYDDRKMLAKGRLPERAEHRALAPYLKPGVTFVDVGANIGSYALFAAAKGADVVAVEANPATQERLDYNIAVNGADCGAVRVVPRAVSDREGSLTLWTTPTNSGFATGARELTTGEPAGEWRAIEVEVCPLCKLLVEAGVKRVDVLKVDVEGLEDRVLLPFLAATPAGDLPDVVMFETNCSAVWQGDCRAALEKAGYEPVCETNDNLIVARRA